MTPHAVGINVRGLGVGMVRTTPVLEFSYALMKLRETWSPARYGTHGRALSRKAKGQSAFGVIETIRSVTQPLLFGARGRRFGTAHL